jgi:hypothetical protein
MSACLHGRGKWLRPIGQWFRGNLADETSSQNRDRHCRPRGSMVLEISYQSGSMPFRASSAAGDRPDFQPLAASSQPANGPKWRSYKDTGEIIGSAPQLKAKATSFCSGRLSNFGPREKCSVLFEPFAPYADLPLKRLTPSPLPPIRKPRTPQAGFSPFGRPPWCVR